MPASPADVTAVLRVLGRGEATAAAVTAELGISQATFSRLVRRHREDILSVGRARATRYFARRTVVDVGREVPVFEVGEDGRARRLGVLHAIRPQGFYFESLVPDAESAVHSDIPYFLHDLRPAGFLGRLVARRHPELQLPSDVQLWTADQFLRYATRFGWSLPGNLILGTSAFELHLAHAKTTPDVVAGDPAVEYERLAEDVMSAGVPGSSAAGEQPKFLVTRTPGPGPVLVKFSPPVRDATSQRIADLLVAEHRCLETIRAHGRRAARSTLVRGANRVFLEVERFDRVGRVGRRGVISLFALDAEFVGAMTSWTDSVAALVRQGHLPAPVLEEVRWLQLFGRLIANTDMHPGNLSFLASGARVLGLAPAYDMAPALYAPVHGHLRDPEFVRPVPTVEHAPVWTDVCAAAAHAWASIAEDSLISPGFRALAAANHRVANDAAAWTNLLPA